MKITMKQSFDCQEPEIKIIYSQMDVELERLVEQLNLFSSSFMIEYEGITKKVPLADIYYFDTADNKTFLYMAEQVYPCSRKLYELEATLSGTPFVRISKSCILNTNHVVSVRAGFSGRLEARLRNGEKIVISKHYLRSFRKKIEQEAAE